MSVKLKTMSVCALFASALFVFLGLQAEQQAKELEEKGVSMPGKIKQAEIRRGSRNRRRYILHATWGEGADRQPDHFFVVTKAFFDARVKDGTHVISPDITVRMIPGNLDSAIIVGGSTNFGGMEWLGGIIGLAGLVGIYFGFIAKR